MSGKLPDDVDNKLLREALTHIQLAEDVEHKVNERMVVLLAALRAISQDQETEAARHFAGVTPRDRREQFESLARKIDEIKEELSKLQSPMRRFKADQNVPPTRPTGLSEFRNAMADHLTGALSAEYVSMFGFEPMRWATTNVSLEHINTWNRAFAVNHTAENIVPELLGRIAAGLRDAQIKITANTPDGGPRVSKIRETLLVNLIALWQEIHQHENPCTYGGGKTKLFHFCAALSRSIGLGNQCTETQLTKAAATFNRLTFPETLPPDAPSLKDALKGYGSA
jgi:hypothetical protein